MAAKTFLKTTLAILLFLVVLAFSTPAHAKTIYVDADAGSAGNGSSWTDAYNYLQDALAVGQYGDEIWVAQGIYKPDQGAAITPGDREATFQLISGVTIKGGYAGAGTPDPNARDIQLYETVLSGDLDGNDVDVNDPLDLFDEPTRAENSYHVVTGSGTGVVDGFIITAGNAVSRSGGGMKNSSGSPTLINCIFRGNSSSRNGGGLYNDWGSPTLINCVFIGNSARSGGGMWCGDSGYPTLVNCTFSNNSAEFYAGGMGNNESHVAVTNCILWGNRDSKGVELWAQIGGGDDPVVNYSCIQGLTGEFGGTGNISDDPLFVEADGADNIPGTADDNLRLVGGSPCIDAGDNSVIPPSVVTDLDGNPRILNGTVDMGAYEGPYQGFLLSAESVVVPEGETATFTVMLAVVPLETVEVTVAVESGDPDITVESGGLLTFDSTNYSQPQTVTLAAAEDKDNLNSSALFKVSGTQIPAAGLRAIERDNDLPAGNILFVDADAPGINTGLNWSEAYTELQDALTVAAMYPGIVNEIRVAEGTYKADRSVAIAPGDRTATFQLKSGLAIYGGYAGFGEPSPDARDIGSYNTTLSGDLNGDDVGFTNNVENSYHVVTASGTVVLDGFTITGGNANGSYPNGYAGGMYNVSGSPTVTNCTFSGNTAHYGGGMFNDSANPTVANCTFSGNSALNSGGGMFNSFSANPTVANCTFSGNSARSGGGMSNYEYSSPTVTNCTFIGNSASLKGGGMYNFGSPPSPTLTNCILWGDMAASGPEIYNYGTSSPTVSYSDVQGGWPGEGNINADPCFVELGYWDANGLWIDGDYHLLEDSPCIDAGAPNYIAEPNETDLDGRPRVVGGRIDMGAYELQPPPPRDLYVDDDAPNDPGPGDPSVSDPLEDGTQTHPFDAIQEAIDAAYDGDTIIVIDGTYFENINFKGKNIILRSTHPNNPDIVAATIIDGNNVESVVSFTGTENKTCVLSGFTIQNGFHDYEYTRGGGGICGGSEEIHTRATIQNNIITRNFAWDGGLSRCDGLIQKNTITGNTSRWYMGGGGLYQCNGIIRNNLIAGNFSGGCESGSGLSHCNGTIENNTITSNFTYGNETVAHCRGTIRNCIIWGNSPVQTWWLSTPSFSCIQGWGSGGDGNIDADPCFVEPGYWDVNVMSDGDRYYFWVEGDYHLLWDSPCIDAGDPNYVPEPNETDLDGKPRVINGRIDMGAYEAPIFAEARILPNTINLASKGKWITSYIWLPEEYDVADIEPNSIFLDDEIQPEQFSVDEHNQVATARFSREDVQPILEVGDINLKITGRLTNRTVFEATDTIKVLNKAGPK